MRGPRLGFGQLPLWPCVLVCFLELGGWAPERGWWSVAHFFAYFLPSYPFPGIQ